MYAKRVENPNSKVMKIAIYGRYFNPEYLPSMQQIVDVLEGSGCKIQIFKDLHDFIRPRVIFRGPVAEFTGHEDLWKDSNLLLSVGGDGTLLDTIMLVRDTGIHIAGINLGRLGFLSSTSRHEITQAVGELLAGHYSLDPRSLVRLDSVGGHFGNLNFALNEVSIYKSVPNTMITVQAWVDGMFLNSYWADGLIIATPTGSTAYSLSCGGPIIAPGCANFLVTPIASHNLTVRPIVIPDSSEIRIRVDSGRKGYNLSLDSRMEVLQDDTELLLRKAGFLVNLVRLNHQHFYRTIRDKLAWGLDARN
jgi:NAD+ kinase